MTSKSWYGNERNSSRKNKSGINFSHAKLPLGGLEFENWWDRDEKLTSFISRVLRWKKKKKNLRKIQESSWISHCSFCNSASWLSIRNKTITDIYASHRRSYTAGGDHSASCKCSGSWHRRHEASEYVAQTER